MKIAIAFVAIIGLVSAANSVLSKDTKYANKEFLEKQKFLLEIVYRIEDALFFEEYIKLGKSFSFNIEDYVLPEKYHGHYMKNYYKAYKHGVTLPKGEFFGALVDSHFYQLYGLMDFFYFAKNWEILQRNICWARLHANEGLFVHALTLTLMHRPDLEGFVLPMIYEIFPQYFFNSKLIYQAEKFEYDNWMKYSMYEKEYQDFLYKDYTKYFKEYGQLKNYFYTKDWKVWQWWKLMGLGEHWYSDDHFFLRDNIDYLNEDPKYGEMLKDVKKFWMPVDYTRDVEFINRESALSYFTEDLEWNAYWYYINLDYTPFLSGKYFGNEGDSRGEFYFYFVRQMLTRYYFERLSHGYGDIPDLTFYSDVEYGYNPQLIHFNGVGFSYRKNYYEYETYGNFQYIHKVQRFLERVEDILTQGYYLTSDGKKIDLHQPQAIEYLGDIMQGNIDSLDKYFFGFWYTNAHKYFGQIVEDKTLYIQPHVFLNHETLLRDPLFYQFYKKITHIFNKFYDYIPSYSHSELHFPGVEILEVKVNDLYTYFDWVDFDVSNLLNDKPRFVDGEFIWNTSLLARQSRLNHKNFEFEFFIKSEKEEKIAIRTFLGPKYDQFGQTISINENRENFLEIDLYHVQLKSGVNNFTRNSKDFYWSNGDRHTYTEFYQYVRAALEGKYEFPLNYSPLQCNFPDRLLIPRGWPNGMPMQFFFFVYPQTESSSSTSSDPKNSICSIVSGIYRFDNHPYGYPLDRKINEFEFFVPNMYFKDVKIYHLDTFDKYHDYEYENFGKFDYNYLHN
ncbi:arylphorin subunit C223-like [Haematobia irritans]|uniref:arylphorin subunit C223-like n=1 Tax=Haematobia irritans TaxID=7368 RepID=UPI003F501CDD